MSFFMKEKLFDTCSTVMFKLLIFLYVYIMGGNYYLTKLASKKLLRENKLIRKGDAQRSRKFLGAVCK